MPQSCAQGPGRRYTIWVQGCSIHCPGCSNLDTWPFEGGRQMTIEEIVKDMAQQENLDGVTITGGEPLDQYPAIYELCSRLFLISTVFMTTGYTIEKVKRKYSQILDVLDILCTGPFQQGCVCQGEWRGSSNQELHFLTDHGKRMSQWPVVAKEYHISTNGQAIETGFTA